MSNLTPRINRLESNIVIDGAMEIWPEGTSRSVANNTAPYGSVLFRMDNGNTSVTLTNSRQTSVPSNTNLTFSNQVSKTAAGTLASTTYCMWQYFVEGNDIYRMWNQETTVLFWVRSSVASNRSLTIVNGSNTHSYIQQYSISAANAWELKAIRLPALSTCPGAISRDNTLGLQIRFSIVAGSTFQSATTNQWVSGNYVSGIGEDTTWLTGTAHNFSITGVMVLPGNWEGLTAAQYNFVRAGRNFAEEIAISQRYFEKSYDLNTDPATLTRVGVRGGDTAGTGNYETSYIRKRIAPNVVFYNPDVAGNTIRYINTISSPGTPANVTPTNITSGETSVIFEGSSVNDNFFAMWHFTADARF